MIVSAGAINSPQLLLLSGVGPATELQKLGIPVVHDLPDVIFGNTNGPSLMIGFPGSDLIRNSNR